MDLKRLFTALEKGSCYTFVGATGRSLENRARRQSQNSTAGHRHYRLYRSRDSSTKSGLSARGSACLAIVLR